MFQRSSFELLVPGRAAANGPPNVNTNEEERREKRERYLGFPS
jgi:hypothetical protein